MASCVMEISSQVFVLGLANFMYGLKTLKRMSAEHKESLTVIDWVTSSCKISTGTSPIHLQQIFVFMNPL